MGGGVLAASTKTITRAIHQGDIEVWAVVGSLCHSWTFSARGRSHMLGRGLMGHPGLGVRWSSQSASRIPAGPNKDDGVSGPLEKAKGRRHEPVF